MKKEASDKYNYDPRFNSVKSGKSKLAKRSSNKRTRKFYKDFIRDN